MKIIQAPKDVTNWVKEQQLKGKTVALVPTMGALHAGHMSLVEQAQQRADYVIVSIFVNPTQFGPNEDFEKYPRLFEQDCQKCQTAGVDLVFAPQPADMYHKNHSTFVEETSLSQYLCGESRPSHFRGVCTVVLKLFMICRPDLAVFGQKDAQQALIIKRMASDLNLETKLHVAPIIRESDGVAMSSRNAYLTPIQRKQALVLSQALEQVKILVEKGEDFSRIKQKLIDYISTASEAQIDYVVIVDEETLDAATPKSKQILISLAVYFGQTRLIDNLRITKI